MSFLILTDMKALNRFFQELQLAHVTVNLQSQFSLIFNGYKNVRQYTQEIIECEMALLEEYAKHMESPGKECWDGIYLYYLHICKNNFCFNTDNTLQNSNLEIEIKGGNVTGKLPESILADIQEFLFVQYNSLKRVLNCMGDNSLICPSVFQWKGKMVELLEYLIYPYMLNKIIPLTKDASKIMWIKSMFMLLYVQIPNNLYQITHKLLLREDPFRFLHYLIANGRLLLEEG